jgi:hypothetical protein
MNGQWIGPYVGTNSGTIVVDADDVGAFYEGHAYVFDAEAGMPAMIAHFRTSDKGDAPAVSVLSLNAFGVLGEDGVAMSEATRLRLSRTSRVRRPRRCRSR